MERAEKEELTNAVEELRQQYEAAAERIEAEQTTVLGLRRDGGELKKAISDLESKNRTLAANLQQTDASYRQKLGETNAAFEAAQRAAAEERAAKEDATAAVLKMESIIRSAQEEMMASQEAAEQARAALAAERASRAEAEEANVALQRQVAAISAAEDEARSAAQQQLAGLQADYEAAKARLLELQAAKPKRAPRAKKAIDGESNGADEEGESNGAEAPAADVAPKKRGRPKKVVTTTAAENEE